MLDEAIEYLKQLQLPSAGEQIGHAHMVSIRDMYKSSHIRDMYKSSQIVCWLYI